MSSPILALTPAGASTSGSLTPDEQASLTPDQQLDLILQELESLPQDLKDADPRTYPGYEEALRSYLGDMTVVQPGDQGDQVEPGDQVMRPTFNFWTCASSLAAFVTTSGIPVAKIIGWIRRSRQLWGGFRGVWNTVRSGEAASEIGQEAADVLEGVLGLGGVAENCF